MMTAKRVINYLRLLVKLLWKAYFKSKLANEYRLFLNSFATYV